MSIPNYGVIWNRKLQIKPGHIGSFRVIWGQTSYLITVAFLFQRIIVWQVCEFFCWRITKLIFVLGYQLNFTFYRWWNILIWIWRHNAYKMILKSSFKVILRSFQGHLGLKGEQTYRSKINFVNVSFSLPAAVPISVFFLKHDSDMSKMFPWIIILAISPAGSAPELDRKWTGSGRKFR